MQKRAAAIHDISGIGKCSLTVALPVISAAGIEAAALPTAVLSTHTGNIEGFTYRDLTDDMEPVYRHWKSLGIEFDAIYSGFLGSTRQVDIVCGFIDAFRKNDTVVLIDPAMADSGEMYKTFKPGFCDKMRELCRRADIIVPNITETAFLLGEDPKSFSCDKENIERVLRGLTGLGASTAVITGVAFEKGKTGCAVYDGNKTGFYFTPEYPGIYYGTGDLFASALLGAYLNGKDIFQSARIALDFTCGSIKRTFEAGTDTRLGVNFEEGIKDYIKSLED